MTQLTARRTRVTEHHKARARAVLLTLIGLICPPLAGVRSVAVWIFYVVFLFAYSLWSLRLTRNFSGDRRLGYLLCATDTAILLPVLVWSSAPPCVASSLACAWPGVLGSYWSDRNAVRRSRRVVREDDGIHADSSRSVVESPLERALRVRLHVYEATHTRFALVVLRIVRFEEIGAYYGEEAAEHMIDHCLAALPAPAGRRRPALRAARRAVAFALLHRFG